MNVSAASRRSITSLHSHASRLDSAQQHPSDAVVSGRSKLRGIDPQRLKTGVAEPRDKLFSESRSETIGDFKIIPLISNAEKR